MGQLEIDVFIKEIGNRIRELRKEQDITQLDLATKSDIDERQIQRLERGQTSPTLKTLVKITNGLNINFLDFFNFVDREENKK